MSTTSDETDARLHYVVMLRSAQPDRWRAGILEAQGWGVVECLAALKDSDAYRWVPAVLRLDFLQRPGTRTAAAWAAESARATPDRSTIPTPSSPPGDAEPTHAYVGRKRCGCAVSVGVDRPIYADDFAGWIRQGLALTRLTIPEARAVTLGCAHEAPR